MNGTTVQNMRCEHLVAPLGISSRQPRFSWELSSGECNVTQKAYRIVVGRTRSFSEESPDLLWDSGKKESDSQHDVVYGGSALEKLTGYYWKLKVWTGAGVESAWSEGEYFECGFFEIDDWDSNWIAYKWAHVPPAERSVNHLRKEFSLEKGKNIRQARAYVAATAGALGNDTLRMNLYEFHLNGAKVGKDIYNPGQVSERRGRALFRTHDVTTHLRGGENAVGLIFCAAKISFKLRVEYDDGSTVEINSDSRSRMTYRGPFIRLWKHDVYEYGGKGEYYDAREEYSGWDLPGYDDSSWRQALPCSPAELLAAQMQSVQVTQVLQPARVSRLDDGRSVIDFAQNFNGHVAIRTRGPRGTKISLRFGENVFEDATVNFKSTFSNQKELSIHEDVYIKKSDEPEEYAPRFANHGFRYVEVTGYPGELAPSDIKANVVHSTVLNGTEFTCSDDWLQRLHNLFIWTFRSNLVSVMTDNPVRERQGWLGDPAVTAPDMCTAFDMRLFYEKRFDDFADCQERGGYVPYICPFPMVLNQLEIVWSGHILHMAWEAYLAYGEISFLERNYNVLRRFVEFMCQNHPDLSQVVRECAPWRDAKSPDTRDGEDFFATVYYFRWFDLFARIASVLGRSDDADCYRQKAGEVRDTINRHYFHEGRYYSSGSQGAMSLPLYFGIVPDHARRVVLEELVSTIERDRCITTGLVGTYYLMMALEDNGRNDVIYRLLRSDVPYTWGCWLTRFDATTALEHWYCDDPGKINHFAFNQNSGFIGGVSGWFFRVLAGIQSTSPGYKTIRIKPYVPDGLERAGAVIQSVRGPIESRWKSRAGTFRLDVTIPCNTTAEVHVRRISGMQVREVHSLAQKDADSADGGSESSDAVFRVGSGTYSFVCEPS